ncbi:MAG TPA: hypothetical protein DCG12_19685 [Planctomycetaceae bacterium]|nr:hypothetical protein [Planctomycetaceae bacterium]
MDAEMKKTPQSNLLNDFFFREETPFGLALARIVVPLAVSVPMWFRLPRVRELFTSDGTPTQLFELFGNGNVLPVFSPAIAVPLYGVMLLCLLFASMGFRTRLSFLIATPLYVYFNLLDAIGTMTKYSVIGTHLLILLTVSQSGMIWSVDAILNRRKNVLPQPPPKTAVWAARLIQLLFCFVYFGAAVTKIQTAEFFTGEQMRYWMLSNWNYNNPVGEQMALWSWILPVSAYCAVVWEMLFAFLVFQKRTRVLMIGLGVMFHFMTWVTLGLYIFPTICISGYLAFITEEDFIRIRSTLRRWRATQPVARLTAAAGAQFEKTVAGIPSWSPALVTWGLLLAVASVAMTEGERLFNIYGVSASGKMRLTEMDTERASHMINGAAEVREKDKFFSFDIGTVMIGNQLANRRTEFTYGELMIAQCNLNPPHEDMVVECVLMDTEDHVIEHSTEIVTRDMLRYNFVYTIGSNLLPGQYQMILRSGRNEVYRRGFRVTGTPPDLILKEGVLTN